MEWGSTTMRRGGTSLAVLAATTAVAFLCAGCSGSPSPAATASPGTSAPIGSVAVYVNTREVPAPASSPDIAATGWPFAGDPASFGEPFTSTLDAWPVTRCAVLDSAAATAAVGALPDGLLVPVENAPGWSSGTLGWAARGMDVLLMVQEVAPADAGRPCGELWLAQFDPAGG